MQNCRKINRIDDDYPQPKQLQTRFQMCSSFVATTAVCSEGIKWSNMNNIYSEFSNFSSEHERIFQVNSGDAGPVLWPQYKTKQIGSLVLPHRHLETPKTVVIVQDHRRILFQLQQSFDGDLGIGSVFYQPVFQ